MHWFIFHQLKGNLTMKKYLFLLMLLSNNVYADFDYYAATTGTFKHTVDGLTCTQDARNQKLLMESMELLGQGYAAYDVMNVTGNCGKVKPNEIMGFLPYMRDDLATVQYGIVLPYQSVSVGLKPGQANPIVVDEIKINAIRYTTYTIGTFTCRVPKDTTGGRSFNVYAELLGFKQPVKGIKYTILRNGESCHLNYIEANNILY